MIRRFAPAFLFGLASATGFEPLGWWPSTVVALAALIHLVSQAPTKRAALGLAYWFAVGHFIVGLNWIAGAFRYQDAMPVWFGWLGVVLLSFYLAIYPAMAAGLAWKYGRRHSIAFVLIFAASWTVTEWLRATVFTGFAWNPLGVVALPLAQPAMLVGSYGLSALVMLLAGVIWLTAMRRWEAGFWSATLLATAFGGSFLWQIQRGHEADHVHEKTGYTAGYDVRIIQPNIGQQDKHDDSFDAVNFARLEAQMGVPTKAPRLIFWPEAAVPDHIGEDDGAAALARARIISLMGPRDVLLLGNDKIFSERYTRDGILYERWVGAANSVFALTGRGQILWRYDKAHLVPYGEYLPMRPFLSAIGLSRLVPGDLDFWPGPGPQSHPLPGFGKAGVQICYEIVFSGQVVDAGNRPDFLFNPSNDAWFGSWGPPQHLAQARLRALEEGLPVIRSTPTGISAIIDANGQIMHALPYQKPGFIAAPMPAPHAATPFARWGNSLSLLFALLLGAAGIALSRRAR